MLIDLNTIKNARKAPTQNVVDLFKSEEYSTKVLYKKEQLDGKTYIRGVFSSVKKGDSRDAIDTLEDNHFYYSHNQSEPPLLAKDSQIKTSLTKTIFIAIISIVATIELIKYFLHSTSHNDIEMSKCQEVNIA
jgi:hypothetical protein